VFDCPYVQWFYVMGCIKYSGLCENTMQLTLICCLVGGLYDLDTGSAIVETNTLEVNAVETGNDSKLLYIPYLQFKCSLGICLAFGFVSLNLSFTILCNILNNKGPQTLFYIIIVFMKKYFK